MNISIRQKYFFLFIILPLFLFADIKLQKIADNDLMSSNRQETAKAFETLIIKSKDEMSFLWVYSSVGVDTFTSRSSKQYEISLPEGIYNIITGGKYSKHISWTITRDSLDIGATDTLIINKDEAIHKNTYQLLREDNTPLKINSIIFFYLTKPDLYTPSVWGVSLSHLSVDSSAFIQYYNKKPSMLHTRWLVKGKQNSNNGNLYLIDGKIPFSGKDSILTNNPENYTTADIAFELPDSLQNMGSPVQVGTKSPGQHWYLDDPDYYFPFSIPVYTDTSTGLKFSHDVNLTKTYGDDLQSVEMFIGNEKVYGFNSPDQFDSPVIVSETHDVRLGVTPTFWYGRFKNSSENISIFGDFGYLRWQQLFLSQTNDVLNHVPYYLTITGPDNYLQQDTLYPTFRKENAAPLQLGFSPEDLSFPVAEGIYSVIIKDTNSLVAGLPAKTEARATFDLGKKDKDPPYLDYFQILSDRVISNVIVPETDNIVRFRPGDNYDIDSVFLFLSVYKQDHWQEMRLNKVLNEFRANIPPLEEQYYDLRLRITDKSNNELQVYFSPAFIVDKKVGLSGMSLKKELFNIENAFPNPFNSSISIRVTTPVSSQFFSLDVFDISGRKIKTIFEGPGLGGQFEYTWQGDNERGMPVSTGIYYIVLKGNDWIASHKVLLLK